MKDIDYILAPGLVDAEGEVDLPGVHHYGLTLLEDDALPVNVAADPSVGYGKELQIIVVMDDIGPCYARKDPAVKDIGRKFIIVIVYRLGSVRISLDKSQPFFSHVPFSFQVVYNTIYQTGRRM